MNVVEEAMRALMAAGVEGEALIGAVSRIAEAAASEQDKRLGEVVAAITDRLDSRLPPYDPEEHRKALARARQARYAEKRQRSSENVSEASGSVSRASSIVSEGEKEKPQTPKEKTTPIPPLKGGTFPVDQPEKPFSGKAVDAADERTPSRSARRKPSRPLPDGFPTDELIREERDKALLAGIDLDATREAAKFRNHALSTDRRCANWVFAWRNWADKARDWAPKLQVVARPAGPEDPWPGRLTRWRIAQYWDSDWGPKPGADGYLGPPIEERAA